MAPPLFFSCREYAARPAQCWCGPESLDKARGSKGKGRKRCLANARSLDKPWCLDYLRPIVFRFRLRIMLFCRPFFDLEQRSQFTMSAVIELSPPYPIPAEPREKLAAVASELSDVSDVDDEFDEDDFDDEFDDDFEEEIEDEYESENDEFPGDPFGANPGFGQDEDEDDLPEEPDEDD